MFACCFGKDPVPLTTVAPTEPRSKATVVNAVTLRAPHLLGAEPGPTPVLPFQKVEPPTPDLSPDEIAKINANLEALQIFVKDLWNQQTAIITGVWAKIQAEVNNNKSSTDNKIKHFFEDFFEVDSFVTGIAALIVPELAPIFVPTSIVAGALSALLSTNGDASKTMGSDDITDYSASHFQINDAWYHNMNKLIYYLINNTNDSRDLIFTHTGITQTATLRSLLNQTFPTSGIYYNNWLYLCYRIFKRRLVLPELVKSENQFLDIYFIQDNATSYVEFGHVYQPCGTPYVYGSERTRNCSKEDMGLNALIWANGEATHYDFNNIQYVESRGNTDDNLFTSWQYATGDFLTKVPSAFIFPWATNGHKMHTQKYFIIEGFAKMRDDQNKPHFKLGSADFLNWLFIDDGAGNITNSDGVAFRYEVFRTKQMGYDNDIFLHAQQISDAIVDQGDAVNWTAKSQDYWYGPPESRDMNQKFHVYTGDLLLKQT